MEINKKFWKGKRVLVTGHTGFKGGWLSLWLQDLEANVVGYALEPDTKPSLYTEALVYENMVSVHDDIKNVVKLKSIFNKHKPEIVFHLAAQSLVLDSYENPSETYEVNVMGTLNVLEAIRCTESVRQGYLLHQINVMKIKSGYGVIGKMILWVDLIHTAVARVVQNY